MKTTFAFIEAVRVEIKNAITKINKEIKEGKLLPGKEENDDKSAVDKDASEHEEEGNDELSSPENADVVDDEEGEDSDQQS